MTAPSNETNEEPSLTSWKTYAVGIQMLFVAFGALVLIPILVGMHPSIALFTAGAGTLLFTFITRGQIPVFLASSFAFLAPMSISLEKYGYGATFCGMFSVGIVYAILAIAIAYFGPGFIKRILPPIVTGPVIMVIGLGLAPTAASMAVSSAGSSDFSGIALIVSFSTAGTAIAMALNKNRTLNLLPILIAIIVGYLVSIPFGLVDFKPVIEAAPIQWPWTSASAAGTFEWMEFSLPAILLFIPVSIVPAVEHFGDILAVQSVTKKDYLKEPGLHRTILGDGVATALAEYHLLGSNRRDRSHRSLFHAIHAHRRSHVYRLILRGHTRSISPNHTHASHGWDPYPRIWNDWIHWIEDHDRW